MPPEDKQKAGILISDLHFSSVPPVFRHTEKDWLKTQAGYVKQVKKLANQDHSEGVLSPVLPIFCAGDVFDKWNAPAKLINWALEHLPFIYAVPGQHDLPYHNYANIKDSAYWTLVKTGRVYDVTPGHPVEVSGGTPIRVHGFPWGFPVKPLRDPHAMILELCLSHSFIWTATTGYPGAPLDQRLKPYKKKLRNYDVVHFGDNHKPVSFNLDKSIDTVTIFNPGGFVRRTADQLHHRPRVGILYSDGSVEPYYLDTSEDQTYENAVDIMKDPSRLEELLNVLRHVPEGSADFEGELKRSMDRHNVSSDVRKFVLQCLET